MAERARALHVSSLVFDAGRHLASLLSWGAMALVFAARSEEAWYLVLLLPPFVGALARYVSFRYTLTEDHLVIREGLLVRSVRHVPYARIQTVDTLQGPLHRLLDVVEVRLETASGEEPEAVFRVVSSAQLADLRARVLGSRSPATEETLRPPGEEPFFRMGWADILLFGLGSQKGLLYLGGLLVALRELEPWDELQRRFGADPEAWLSQTRELGTAGWLVLALLLFLVLQGLTLAWAILTLARFRIERRGEDLRTTCGLLTRQTASLPRGRIQLLEVRQGLLQRWLGRVSLRARSAGGESTRESRVARRWLVPLAPRAELESLLAEVQPAARFGAVAWRPVHRNAARRAFRRHLLWLVPALVCCALRPWWQGALACGAAIALAWWTAREGTRALGWGLGEGAIFLRSGLLRRRLACVRFEKIQSVALTRSPFDRRARMATLSIDTAGSKTAGAHFSIPYLGLREACSVARRLQREAASVPFPW